MRKTVQSTKNENKIFDIIGSAFISIVVILSFVVFTILQTAEDHKRKDSRAILSEISTNHAHAIHRFIIAVEGQMNTAAASLGTTKTFDAQKALEEITDPTPISDIEVYIINSKGIIINAIGEELALGDNVVQIFKLENYNKIPSTTTLTLNNKQFHIGLTPMLHEGWTAMALMQASKAVDSSRHSTYFAMTALGALILLCVGFTSYFMCIQRKAYCNTQAYAEKLQQTLNEIPCGIVRCLNNDEWTILDYTDSLPSVIGISSEDIRSVYNNCWRDMIHPDDRALAKAMIPTAGEGVMSAEYRIKRKDGSSLYIMDRTRIIESENGSFVWCVIIDVDDLKKSQAQERNMVGQYRHLLEMSDNILYEFDMEANQFAASLEFFKKFEYPLPPDIGLNYYPVDSGIIHPDDMDLFMSMQMRIKVGGKVTAALLRIKTYDDRWLWCQLRQTAWTDDAGKLKAIGKIDNVDEETRTLQKLQDDVQRDSFTTLYNKVATEELITREIINDPAARGAFCIIDIDNFKQVNSSFGHVTGDAVIKNLANGLSHIFRSDDIVGRIGGDEFIVYMKNVPNLRPLLHKTVHVQEHFRQTFEENNIKVSISCSIGIALFPKDGASYEELYRHADKALYRSKMSKDTYNFYDPEIDL